MNIPFVPCWFTLLLLLVPGGGCAIADEKIGGMDRDAAAAWWAFQPLPEADPEPRSATIDALLDQASPVNPPAEPRALLRRLHYGLTGLPPGWEDVKDFVADPSSVAYQKEIERLLDSPAYGVHWGRRWLDLVRYADTAGENTDRPLPHAWRYRNWVFEAVNRDLPYDAFVRMQLAGDLRPAGDAEGIIATGYLAIARRFGHDIDQDIHLMYEDVIDNLGKTFLGLTISCARCHDHPYDPVTARDYYALYGIFSSTRFAYSGCEKNGKPKDLVPLLSQAEVDALIKPWRERQQKIDATKKVREQAIQSGRKRAKEAAGKARRLLAEASVGEGESVAFDQAEALTVRAGEVIQLTVLPNGNHGADSTLLEWAMTTEHAKSTRWNVASFIDRLTEANPLPGKANALWYFLEDTDGPELLPDAVHALQGRSELNKWAAGDLPSVFVNSAEDPVKVWTTLPPRSVFVHPGPRRKVAIAWVSPADTTIRITGRIADAHPSGGDGVSFQLAHIADPAYGAALAGLAGAQPLPAAHEPKPEIPLAYAVAEAAPQHVRLHVKGEPKHLGEEVPRGWLEILGGMRVPENAGSGRRELADWIIDQPLFARVMVNRIWQGHFGKGLVRTPSDFGARGEAPDHPELLDWLAAQFVASGYRVKTMHRLILGTAAYRRSSNCSEAQQFADPDNRRLTRFSPRRLGAEELRDSLLKISGALDPSPGGAHPFPPEETWKFTQHHPFNAVYETNRRSAYLMVQRQRRHPFLSLFDGSDPNASTAERDVTTVPTQALYFLNDPFFHAQAARLAEDLVGLPAADRLAAAYRRVFQRDPRPNDRVRAKRFFSNYPGEARDPWSAYARVLLASNEFLHLD